jgi:class 3 adenylate cyclase
VSDERLEMMRFLEELGVSREAMGDDPALPDLQWLMWMRVFIEADELLSLPEVAARTGVPLAKIEELVRLLGVPITQETGVAERDLDVIRTFASFASLFGEDVARQITRTIGSSIARIAEALTATTRVALEKPILRDTGYTGFARAAVPIVTDFFPRLARVMDRLVRYHILATSRLAWDVDAEMSAMTIDRAVGFADMVGFTTHAGKLSTRELTQVIDAFEGSVSDAIAIHGGRAVKFIGDEVFFSFVEPDAACACALALLKLADDDTIPEVRVGMAYGQVVARSGDYFGPIVNLASRLVDIADTGEAVVSQDLATVASGRTFEPRAPRELKGVAEPVAYARLRS